MNDPAIRVANRALWASLRLVLPVLPAFLMETAYEGEHGVTPAQQRAYMWSAVLSAIGGVVFGNNPVWLFDTAKNPGWIPALQSTGANDMKRMGALLDLVPWQRLVPSGLASTPAVVTGGGGTYGSWSTAGSVGGDDYVVAAVDAGTIRRATQCAAARVSWREFSSSEKLCSWTEEGNQ